LPLSIVILASQIRLGPEPGLGIVDEPTLRVPLERSTLTEVLRLFSPLPRTLSGDAFGLIYDELRQRFVTAPNGDNS